MMQSRCSVKKEKVRHIVHPINVESISECLIKLKYAHLTHCQETLTTHDFGMGSTKLMSSDNDK